MMTYLLSSTGGIILTKVEEINRNNLDPGEKAHLCVRTIRQIVLPPGTAQTLSLGFAEKLATVPLAFTLHEATHYSLSEPVICICCLPSGPHGYCNGHVLVKPNSTQFLRHQQFIVVHTPRNSCGTTHYLQQHQVIHGTNVRSHCPNLWCRFDLRHCTVYRHVGFVEREKFDEAMAAMTTRFETDRVQTEQRFQELQNEQIINGGT